MRQIAALFIATVLLTSHRSTQAAASAEPLRYSVSWLGNSFSGASNKWVQNFLIHTKVQPDGTVNTWSHWDEGGRKFGVYKDGDVIGNTNVNPNSLETRDKLGRLWKLEVSYTDPKHQEWEFTPQGITSVKPGEITPTKFWGIRGLGMDAAGNLYVAMSEQGTVLRSFTPDGTLRWELHGEFFCDVATADPADDAATVWGIQERYAMDGSKSPGRDSKWVSYTLNRHKYPNDPRGLMHVKQQGEHGLTSPQIVYLNGRRFLFVGGMFASNFINIFRYDFQGLDAKGNPIYSADKVTVLDKPKGVNKVARVCYLDDTDTLVLGEEGGDMRHISRVFVCKGYLAGNRETVSFMPGPGKEAACVTAAGNYAFKRSNGEYLVFVEENYKAKSLIYRWAP